MSYFYQKRNFNFIMNHPSLIEPSNKLMFLLFSALLLVFACSKSGNEDAGTPQPEATLVSGLTYSLAVLDLKQGESGNSVKPTKSGTAPVTYTITTNPSSGGAISIDADGAIKASGSLAIGQYKVTVIASNAAGAATFSNAYTINVTANTSVPARLVYSPGTLTLTFGTAGSSVAPTIISGSAVTYTGTVSPGTTGIVISGNGVIASSTSLPVGTYQVSITATNSVGSATFKNAYTVTVNAASAASTFNTSFKALIQNNCGSCHGSGGPQTNYTVYSTAKNNIDEILRRIKLEQGAPGMMPRGGTRLSQTTIDQFQKWKDDGLLE